jgi:F420H(2)-dependent quinone reductase
MPARSPGRGDAGAGELDATRRSAYSLFPPGSSRSEMGEREADGLNGLTPKEQTRFRRFRRMVARFPRIRRVMGGGQRAAFRLTGGRLGGTLQGVPVCLLTTTGRRSGRARTVPIGYTDDGSPVSGGRVELRTGCASRVVPQSQSASRRGVPHPRRCRARPRPRADRPRTRGALARAPRRSSGLGRSPVQHPPPDRSRRAGAPTAPELRLIPQAAFRNSGPTEGFRRRLPTGSRVVRRSIAP